MLATPDPPPPSATPGLRHRSGGSAERAIDLPYTFLENGAGFNSRLFGYARTLLRGAGRAAEEERRSPARVPRHRAPAHRAAALGARRPIYPELEQLTLSFSLERMREWLGPDDPTVRQLLSKESPDQLAKRLISTSKLADPATRLALWKGGAKAVEAANDPMIEIAKLVDERARAIRKKYEDEIEAVTAWRRRRWRRPASPPSAPASTPTPPSPCA